MDPMKWPRVAQESFLAKMGYTFTDLNDIYGCSLNGGVPYILEACNTELRKAVIIGRFNSFEAMFAAAIEAETLRARWIRSLDGGATADTAQAMQAMVEEMKKRLGEGENWKEPPPEGD